MPIKSVFVCPKCSVGMNTDGEKPEKCLACGHMMNVPPKSLPFRMPRSVYSQIVDVANKRIAAVPALKFPPDTDSQTVTMETEKHKQFTKQRVLVETSAEAAEFLFRFEDAILLDLFRECEFITEHMGMYDRKELLGQIIRVTENILRVANNIKQGKELMVRYGNPTPTSDPSAGSGPGSGG